MSSKRRRLSDDELDRLARLLAPEIRAVIAARQARAKKRKAKA